MSEEFEVPQSWRLKMAQADQIWGQVSSVLEYFQVTLTETPRYPDIRLILQNTENTNLVFANPGQHSDKLETIKPKGANSAAMVMLHGKSMGEQMANAASLAKEFNLQKTGLSQRFISALSRLHTEDRVKEAYGPTDYEEQVAQLKPVEWVDNDDNEESIIPIKGKAASYGARPAKTELAFLTKMHYYLAGTHTTPELMETDGMVVAVSTHWKTGEVTTKPIAPSVAARFYGDFKKMPIVHIDPANNMVQKINLGPGKPSYEMRQIYKPMPALNA